jgi:hypothetical protein
MAFGQVVSTRRGPLYFLRWRKWNKAVEAALKAGRRDLVSKHHPWLSRVPGEYPHQTVIRHKTDLLWRALENDKES